MFLRAASFCLITAALASATLAHDTSQNATASSILPGTTAASGHVHAHPPGASPNAKTGMNSPDEEDYGLEILTTASTSPVLISPPGLEAPATVQTDEVRRASKTAQTVAKPTKQKKKKIAVSAPKPQSKLVKSKARVQIITSIY